MASGSALQSQGGAGDVRLDFGESSYDLIRDLLRRIGPDFAEGRVVVRDGHELKLCQIPR